MEDTLFSQIRVAVSKIPAGRVATYGQIAKMVGTRDARMVGWALHGNQDPKVPCHRAIRSDGTLAEGYSLGGWEEQRFRLEKEGVDFISDNKLNLAKYLWRPKG